MSSLSEKLNFIEKTKKEWDSGKNTFSKNGELFLLVYANNKLVGCGGINVDPYTDNRNVGRIRHLHVLPEYRRNGIARKIIDMIIKASKNKFSYLRLRSNSVFKESNEFYLSCGFQAIDDEFATHRFDLSKVN